MNKKNIEEIEKNLKGQRSSKNRDCVISVLLNERVPISVEEIFYKIKEKNNKLSLSTVYRIIDKLVSLNIVREAAKNDDKSLYELAQKGHHHYIICTKCKKMMVINDCPLIEAEQRISKSTGFYITGHKCEIYGECASCRNSKHKNITDKN